MSLMPTPIDRAQKSTTTETENKSSVANKTEVIDLTELSSDSSDDEDAEDEEESDSDDDIVLDERSREQLRAALNTVSEERLRAILMALCEQIPSVELAMTKEFVVSVSRKRKTTDDGDDDEPEELAPRYELCRNCREEYDFTTEREGVCVLNCDYDNFVDWDEDCHGPMDTEENRKEFPENFKWSCCNEDGVSQGCVQTAHEPIVPRKKRKTRE
uniref:Uncharacterized protein n=1 Tax=Moniliophthora roreri TaxID=221103 RepID=A0A0W0F7W9_MONRR